MITPRFSLTQDDNFLTITIRAPYCNLKELETYVEENDFRFFCSPYYLRLNLPGHIINNDSSSGKFLSGIGKFIFKYQKRNRGEHFEGLDFITTLLTPPNKKYTQPEIEVLSESTSPDEEGNEWHVEQKLPEENDISLTNSNCKYGFANQKCNIVKNFGVEFYSVFDLRNPDEMPLTERKHFRYDTESMAFCPEHYLADYFEEDDAIITIIKEENPWKQLFTESVCFNAKDKDILKDLPNKEYLLNKEETKYILCGLVDILFGYCYDKRITNFEGNCESGWTITKLTATLTWFDAFTNEVEVLTSAFRRSLIYPLYRNFELCNTVLEDLKILLSLGPVFIVKCLLDIYEIFNSSSDPRYILNELYIKDYIIFMQKCPRYELEETTFKVKKTQISKDDMNLNLNQIVDSAIRNIMKGEDILEKMTKLKIKDETDSSDSETDSDSSDSSSSDSDSSSSDSESSSP